MTWAHPVLFALLLLVPLVAALVLLGWRARKAALARFAPPEVLDSVLPRGVHRKRWAQGLLAILALAALAVAAAGPRLGFDWQQRKVQGVSIVLVLDVSRSMDAQDVSPSRIERARREIKDLVGLLRGDAVGLVVFAAGPYVRVPLTVDYDTLLWAVDDTSTSTIRAQGTSLSGALDAATQLLSRAEGSGKAILVISDGEGHDDDAALAKSVQRAKDGGVRIYALGVGEKDGAPIPMDDGGFKKDRKGDVVLTKLDEDRLERLASATGGAYVRAVVSDDDVRALYVDEIRGKLEASERGVRREKVWRERFQWPLAAGLFAMVGAAALGIGRGGIGRRGLPAAILLFALIPRAEASTASDGLAAWRAKDWDKASELLGQARVEDPSNREVAAALADSLYRDGRYRESEQIFDSLAEADPSNKAVHLYNAGNAAYKGGRLTTALEDYQKALAAQQGFEPASKNAQAVQQEIQKRLQKQQEQKDQQQQDQQQQDQKQDGEQQPQDGQQQQQSQDGQQQQPQDAQQADQKQDGKQGDQKATADSSGEQGSRDQQQGNGQNSGDDHGRMDPSQKKDGSDQQNPSDAMAASDDTDAQQDTDAAGAKIADDESAGDGSMTPEEAARLVDGVRDGKPRVYVGGRDTEKDW